MKDSSGLVWQVGMHFDPSMGGADRYFDGLIRGLDEREIIGVAAAFGDAPPPRQFMRPISMGPDSWSTFQRSFALRHLSKTIAADRTSRLVATHFALDSLLLAQGLRRCQIPCVAHFHGPWSEESRAEGQKPWKVALKRMVEKAAYRRTTHFITLSQAFRSDLMNRFGIPLKKISVVPGSISSAEMVVPGDASVCRRLLGWPADRTIILSVRRLAERMGLRELIEAFALLAAKHPNTDLYLAGKGKLEGSLRRFADQSGLKERIRFVGYVPEDRLASAYHAADLTVVPSQALEGFGLSVLESLACGTPVLVSPVGGLPEVMQGLGKELIFENTSPRALGTGLDFALANREALPTAEACRRHVEENFSRTSMVDSILQVYQQVLEESR